VLIRVQTFGKVPEPLVIKAWEPALTWVAPYNMGNDSRTTFAWATIDQGTSGAGWEIGAFVFVTALMM
jgi:hypothetical protein